MEENINPQVQSPPTQPLQQEPPQEEIPPTKSRKKLIIAGLLFLLILTALLLVAFVLYNRQTPSESTTPTPTPIISQEPTPAIDNDLETYIDEENNWQINYPSDLKVDVQGKEQIGQGGIGDVVVFSKLGATQTEGTEFHDGISFTVGVKEKSKDQSLMEFADEDSTPADPEVSSRTALKTIEINGHDGVETTVKGLGEFRIIYLEYPLMQDKVYYISIFAAGPGDSQEEYDLIVENMLNSFKSYR